MRSLVCWDVSTVCALLVRATSADNSAVEMRHDAHAPSLAGGIRIDNPSNDYTAVKLLSMRDFVGIAGVGRLGGLLRFFGEGTWGSCANRKKRNGSARATEV